MNKKLCVLVVDDSQIFCESLQAQLEDFDVDRVDCCHSGYTALELIEASSSSYDAIFVDLHMEGMDGIELIRHVNDMNYRGGIIIVSALDQIIIEHTEELVRRLNLHLLGSILKPASNSAVAFMVRRIRAMRPATEAPPSAEVETVRNALANRKVEAYFQPLIDGSNNSLHSIECVSRLHNREGEVIFPKAFLPTLQSENLFAEFTPLLLDTALKEYKNICSQLDVNVRLRINIHENQLSDNTLIPTLLDSTRKAAIEPEHLILEIDEDFSQTEIQMRNLARLRIAGFHLSLENYGSGFTNIRQLRTLPFGELKIDKELILGMHKDHALKAIIESIEHVAKELNTQVVANGIQYADDLLLLDGLGIGVFQGHFFSRPKSAKEFISWMKKWRMTMHSVAEQETKTT